MFDARDGQGMAQRGTCPGRLVHREAETSIGLGRSVRIGHFSVRFRATVFLGRHMTNSKSGNVAVPLWKGKRIAVTATSHKSLERPAERIRHRRSLCVAKARPISDRNRAKS